MPVIKTKIIKFTYSRRSRSIPMGEFPGVFRTPESRITFPFGQKAVIMKIAPGKKLILDGEIVFVGPTFIELNEEFTGGTAHIKSSTIGMGCRILNSSLEHTRMDDGSQVIYNAALTVSPGYASTLKPNQMVFKLEGGQSFENSNFAQLRGGVVKRAQLELDAGEIVVPSGMSLYPPAELLQKVVDKNPGVPIQNISLLQGHFLTPSGYSHPEDYDRLYEPGLFPFTQLLSNRPDLSQFNHRFYDVRRRINDHSGGTELQRSIVRETSAPSIQIILFRISDNKYILASKQPLSFI